MSIKTIKPIATTDEAAEMEKLADAITSHLQDNPHLLKKLRNAQRTVGSLQRKLDRGMTDDEMRDFIVANALIRDCFAGKWLKELREPLAVTEYKVEYAPKEKKKKAFDMYDAQSALAALKTMNELKHESCCRDER